MIINVVVEEELEATEAEKEIKEEWGRTSIHSQVIANLVQTVEKKIQLAV